jgi:hypothetical protein
MVTLRLDRTDYERINALLGVIAGAGSLEGEGLREYLGNHALTPLPPAEARRLCAETDRQAHEVK